jgi:hypothetical protein
MTQDEKSGASFLIPLCKLFKPYGCLYFDISQFPVRLSTLNENADEWYSRPSHQIVSPKILHKSKSLIEPNSLTCLTTDRNLALVALGHPLLLNRLITMFVASSPAKYDFLLNFVNEQSIQKLFESKVLL